MNVSQYEALIKALETGTLTQAAEDLGYTQSGLTRSITALEEQFGFKLLRRDRNGLSAAAAAFVRCAKEWLEEEGYFSEI